MSKILITGNGFDLFHHLPTKYGHFMAVMETIENKTLINQITFEDLFGSNFKSEYENDYNLIIENYDTQKIIFDEHKILQIREEIAVNSWYHYFKSVAQIETWIDFETQIQNMLLEIVIIFKWVKSNPNNYNFYNREKINVYSNLTFFEFIKEINQQNDVIFENEFLNNHNKTIKEKSILESLANSIEGFISIFNMYLIEIVDLFYENNRLNFTIPLNLIDSVYTFNYTSTIQKIYKLEKLRIIYLHGKSNQDDSLQNMVLGISEISKEIKRHKMFNFTKSYQKILKGSNTKFIQIPNKGDNNEQQLFYIIGHSLDFSDKDYVEDLFKYVENDETNMSEIIVFYYNKDDFASKLKNLFSIIDKISLEDVNKNNRLKFVELTVENIEKEFSRNLTNDSFITVWN